MTVVAATLMSVIAATMFASTVGLLLLRCGVGLRRRSLRMRLWRRTVFRPRGFHVLLRLRAVLHPLLRLGTILGTRRLDSRLRLRLWHRSIFSARLWL
jgi:hypothetical protein